VDSERHRVKWIITVTWCCPQNWKYTIYCSSIRGGSRQQAQKTLCGCVVYNVRVGRQTAGCEFVRGLKPPAHVSFGLPGGWRNTAFWQIEGILQLFTLNNVAESAAWRPQNTGKSFSSRGSALDPAVKAYSPSPNPITSGEGLAASSYRLFGPQMAKPHRLP